MRDELNSLADRIYAEIQYHGAGITVAACGGSFYFFPTLYEGKYKSAQIVYQATTDTTRGKIYGDLYKIYVNKKYGTSIPSSLSKYSNIIKLGYA